MDVKVSNHKSIVLQDPVRESLTLIEPPATMNHRPQQLSILVYILGLAFEDH